MPRPLEGDEPDYDFWAKYEIRELFIPDHDKEVFIVFDYSNLEARLQAEYSGDELLIEMFREGYDMHGYTAVVSEKLDCTPNECKKKYPKLRQTYKSVRFALQYGGTEFAIARSTGMSKEEAREVVDTYYNTFVGEAEYKVKQIKFAHKYGFVYSLMRRKRHLYDINSNNVKTASYNERVALNYPNQAGAADVCTTAQLLLDEHERLNEMNVTQRIQVHDEIVFGCHEDYVEEAMEIIEEVMSTCVKLQHVDLPVSGNYSYESYAKAK